MWHQILAIAWAQFRITRNHLPRTTFGAVAGWVLTSLWYGLYALLATFLAFRIPDFPMDQLVKWLPLGLLGVFLFWQIIPLFTLSSGWSLELGKLQVYPVDAKALFTIETCLRITSAPEMILVMLGAGVGLARHPAVPWLAPLALVLFVPLNLFLQLGIRDLVLHSFERNRFRELFAVLLISIAVAPQLLLRTGIGPKLTPYLFRAASGYLTPWREVARLSLGHMNFAGLAALILYTAACYAFARWMFAKSLVADEGNGAGARPPMETPARAAFHLSRLPGRIFADPLAVLVQKELQSLLRMPRFRVLFGISCVLGIVVFVPAALNRQDPTSDFMRNNLLPVVNVYGLLLLSDALLLNAFGLDRGAAQLYFVTPVALETVLKAKNLAAVVFVALQSGVILLVACAARAPITLKSITSGLLASAVVTVFLLATGNLSSFAMARPVDPKQTFKKQAGAKTQLWLLGCSAGLFILLGFAFLARYALQSDWIFAAVLTFELLVGSIVYRLSLESAVKRGTRDREEIVQTLSRSASPVSLG